MALATAAKLRVADDLHAGPQTAAELAARKRVEADALNRVLRALASVGVFATDSAGRYRLTELGVLMRTGVPGSLRAVADYCGADWSWRSWGDLPETVRTGGTAIDRVFGQPVFDYLRDHPNEAAVFNEGMTGFSTAAAPLVAGGYHWGRFATVVDVGGGHGALLLAVLTEHPGPKGVVFDAPPVAEGATKAIRAAGMAGVCRAEGGDFFQRVPAGDCYVLKNVIHDWADAPATTILRNCRAAALPDAKLVLVELVVPPGDEPHPAKLLDLEMLLLTGGRERTEAEYAALLAGAGWKLAEVIPTKSPFSLLVADAV
jgi:hypothetical protein